MSDDLDAILRLVAEGKLSPADADTLIAALEQPPAEGRGTHVRVQVLNGGQRVVDLRVPRGLASTMLPGISEEYADRIRAALRDRFSGTILEAVDADGDGVVIRTE